MCERGDTARQYEVCGPVLILDLALRVSLEPKVGIVHASDEMLRLVRRYRENRHPIASCHAAGWKALTCV